MEVKAITRNVRISASKGRDLARAVQGKTLADAGEMVLLVVEQLHGEPLPTDTRQRGFHHRLSSIGCGSPLTIQQTSRLFLAERGSVGHFDAICLL